jgi:hypothetical protein
VKTIEETTFSVGWLRAVEYLLGVPKGKDVNVVVGFLTITEDPGIRAVLDGFLDTAAVAKPRKNVLPIETVASTLFPECWYVPERAGEPRAPLYWCRERAAKVRPRISGPHECDRYFDRLVAYPAIDGGTVNQLEDQVLRLRRELRHAGPKNSAYEIGVSEPGDLRIQRPARTG